MLTAARQKISAAFKALGHDPQQILQLLENPKRSGQGHLALPVFVLAKQLKLNPMELSKALAGQLTNLEALNVAKVEAVGGYVNFHLESVYLQNLLTSNFLKNPQEVGSSTHGAGRTMVIDFSSPNVAKPMHIGHLRATVIGQAIVNLAKSQGYKVIGLNHLGDWGVQFGNLAWAYENWRHEYPFTEKPFQSLYEMYVRFHKEAEENPQLAALGAETFLKLENGDEHIGKIWRLVVDESLNEYNRLWKMLNVQHDLVRGESFYNDRLETVVQLLKDKKLLVESEGALVVRLDEENMPPCLIKKTDGASLYATRDIASAMYRHDELKADLNLYVVGADQALHFKQVFTVLQKMGFSWADSCHHVGFGMYRFKDIGKISSRKGNVITLEELLSKAVQLVRELMLEKKANVENIDDVAQKVGIGAIIFNDLVNDRVKNVEFDWTQALSFEGDSGPYVQYCYVRCLSLIRKAGRSLPRQMTVALESDEEKELLRQLLNFPTVLSSAFAAFKPHILATYLLDICRLFNQFYSRHRILDAEEKVQESRLLLVHMTQLALGRGLELLNIPIPDAM